MKIKDLVPWSWEKERDMMMRSDWPFYPLREAMNRLLDDYSRTGFELGKFQEKWPFEMPTPKVDIIEKDKEIVVSAELPGMDEKDIDVSISKNVLTLKGEKKAEKEEKNNGYYRMERSYGAFHRAIPLPGEVETDKIDATFKKGVLTIHVPKTAEAQKEVKKVTIKSN